MSTKKLPKEHEDQYGFAWWILVITACAVTWYDNSTSGWWVSGVLICLACICHAGMVNNIPPKTLFRVVYTLPLLPVWLVKRLL